MKLTNLIKTWVLEELNNANNFEADYFTLNESNINYISSFNANCTLHAFLVTDKNKIIDPTWGLHGKGSVYYYELVPREIWKEFTFKEHDKNFNAQAFADEYIAKVAGKKYHISIVQDKWMEYIKK